MEQGREDEEARWPNRGGSPDDESRGEPKEASRSAAPAVIDTSRLVRWLRRPLSADGAFAGESLCFANLPFVFD